MRLPPLHPQLLQHWQTTMVTEMTRCSVYSDLTPINMSKPFSTSLALIINNLPAWAPQPRVPGNKENPLVHQIFSELDILNDPHHTPIVPISHSIYHWPLSNLVSEWCSWAQLNFLSIESILSLLYVISTQPSAPFFYQ